MYKAIENLQYLILVLLIIGQCVVGQSFFIGQGVYFIANLLLVIRTFYLHRPISDKVKDVSMLGITTGIILIRIFT
jgi:hypothetical protein